LVKLSFGRKKYGSSTNRAVLTVAMFSLFLLYSTSVGVNAARAASNEINTASPNLWNSSTKTIYKTVTVYKTHTTTETVTSTSTQIGTTTQTSTSFVCCETITSTVTSTSDIASTTITETESAQVTSTEGTLEMPFSDAEVTAFGPESADCAVTLSFSTTGMTDAGALVSLNLQWYGVSNGLIGVDFYPSGQDENGATVQFSAATVQFQLTMAPAYQVTIYYTLTAICP
jgi:hypothetical protein